MNSIVPSSPTSASTSRHCINVLGASWATIDAYRTLTSLPRARATEEHRRRGLYKASVKTATLLQDPVHAWSKFLATLAFAVLLTLGPSVTLVLRLRSPTSHKHP